MGRTEGLTTHHPHHAEFFLSYTQHSNKSTVPPFIQENMTAPTTWIIISPKPIVPDYGYGKIQTVASANGWFSVVTTTTVSAGRAFPCGYSHCAKRYATLERAIRHTNRHPPCHGRHTISESSSCPHCHIQLDFSAMQHHRQTIGACPGRIDTGPQNTNVNSYVAPVMAPPPVGFFNIVR